MPLLSCLPRKKRVFLTGFFARVTIFFLQGLPVETHHFPERKIQRIRRENQDKFPESKQKSPSELEDGQAEDLGNQNFLF